MSLQIIYGRSGTGKGSYIFNEISKNINTENKKYIITPEQYSFSAEKELLKSIEKEKGKVAVVNAEVLTFARMAHRVIGEVGGNNKTILSNCGKSMLIYSILSNKKNNLKFLSKSNNNIEMVMRQLTELKKHGISVENLNELKKQISQDDKYLENKLQDILTVYSKFQEKITNNYIDENDSLSVLVENLSLTDMFKDTQIYIDEFVGFTKQEYMIIEKLLEQAERVTITVSSDEIRKTKAAENDIFYTNKETIEKILKIAKENNIKIEKPIYLEDVKRFKNKSLKHLEENIYAFPYKKYQEEELAIQLFLANNQYSEIEEIAKKINSLVREQDYRYRDIAVVTKNIDTYSSLCKAIFNKYEIPVYIDEKRDLSQNILVKYIIAILEIFTKNWSYDSIFNYIKCGFLELENNDIYLLENYALKWDIKGSKWYKQEWNFYDEEEIGKEKLDKIKFLKNQVVNPIVKLKEKLSGNKTAKQISQNLYEFLITNKIDKKLEDKISKLNSLNKLDIATQYETSWKIVMQVLDEIVLVFGDENVTFENYMQILKTGLGQSKLGTIPMAQDQVTVGDVDRSRNHKIKVIFIIGLNDGMFPSINKAEGFLNDNDREKIKQKGIELAKGTLDRIYEDNFNIYKVFSTAEEKIYLSYSSSDIEGKSLRPSMLISRIKNIFPNIKQESDIIIKQEKVISKETTFELLLENLRKFIDGEEINPIWFSIYRIYNENEGWKSKLEASTKALNYKNNAENITQENIDKMYGNTLKTSVSKLEQYSGCPFSYYLKYGLKLNDKETLKIEAIDTGTFMHDVIDSFFTRIEEEKLDIKQITEKETENIISDIITIKLNLNRNYIFKVTAKYKVLAQRLKRVTTLSIKYIIQSIKQSDFKVFGHEIEFGKNGKYKAITMKTEDGKNIEITGKIDRIDVLKNPDGTYVRIIDYKSSVRNIDLNKVAAGLQIQLLTYLNETCKVEDFLPAGILYFGLLDKNISAEKNITDEEIEDKIKQEFKMKGLILADVNIIKQMDTKIEETRLSTIIPAALKKDGQISTARTSGITKEQFIYLQEYTNNLIKQISEEILSGKIDIKPYSNIKEKQDACTYCNYKSICGKK